MDNFIVSARKYRPVTFDLVVGQKSITTTLKNAIKNNHLAQAFLFCGPRGVGKTTCARILAKTINCLNLNENMEPCDQCDACVSFNQSTTFNIFELDAASNNSVDDIRTLVDQVRIPPQMGKYKVYIIDEVHMLSASAFNAFLKTLEEPPAYAKFILATTEKHKIIPTILSRCQVFDFKRITIDDIIENLQYVAGKEGVTACVDSLRVIANKADGSMRDALSIFDQMVSLSGNNLVLNEINDHLNVLGSEIYFNLVNFFVEGDHASTLLLINEIIEKGFDEHQFAIGIGEHLRNLLVCKDSETIMLLDVSEKTKEQYLSQAVICSQPFILKALDIINKLDLSFKVSNNKRLFLELSLMQICSLSSGILNDSSESPKVHSAKPQNYQPSSAIKQNNVTEQPVAQIKTKKEIPVEKNNEPASKSPIKTNLKMPGSISIKQTLNGLEEKKSAKEKNELAANPENIISNPFTIEKFEENWKLFAESIAKDFPSLYSTLTKRQPELDDQYNITITIDNSSQEDDINLKKTDILDFLRINLNNFKIQLSTKLTEVQDNQIAYSSQEKFNKMKEVNPAVNQLKNQLNLEIEP